MRRAFSLLYWAMAVGLAASVALSATHGAFMRPTPDMLRDWTTWTATWRDRLLERRTACRLGQSKAMAPVDRLARHLERLHLAYTTALNGFSDVGRRQLVETRKAFEALGVDRPPDVSRP